MEKETIYYNALKDQDLIQLKRLECALEQKINDAILSFEDWALEKAWTRLQVCRKLVEEKTIENKENKIKATLKTIEKTEFK